MEPLEKISKTSPEIWDRESFIDTIKCLNLLDSSELHDSTTVNWDEKASMIIPEITKPLYQIKQWESCEFGVKVPNEGLKGIYFWIGDRDFLNSFQGSLYFNEDDWAANAHFSPGECETYYVFESVADSLDYLDISEDKIEEIMVSFSVYTILRALNKCLKIPEILNAAMVIGYSSGDELVLGEFIEGRFFQNLTLIDGGYYDNNKYQRLARPVT